MKFKPIPHDVEKDKSYFWCSCGRSKNQPFCDGSHASSEFTPLKYVAEKTETKYFCTCKKTQNHFTSSKPKFQIPLYKTLFKTYKLFKMLRV